MNAREIKLLWEVVATGSVTRAAERVHMSQPAASAAIRQIETQLGFDLFTREKRRLALTAKGSSLLPEVSNTVAALASLDRLADELRADTTRRINIGCIAPAATTILPAATRVLRQQMPEARIVVRIDLAVEIAGMVAEQRVDFGLVVGDTLPQGAGVADVAALSLYAVMPPNADLASHASISLQSLSAHPYITLARQLQIGSLTARKFEEAGLAFSPAVEVMQFSAACAFAEAGYGVAVLDALSLPFARKLGLVARPLEIPERIPLRLLWPKASALAKYATPFREAILTAVRAECVPVPGRIRKRKRQR
jgi:DNA-binding transcriptional LysR family regulator